MNEATAIARLFVALPVPLPVCRALSKSQLPPGDGVRPVPASNLHITLHFIGLAEIELVKNVLQSVIAPRFSVHLEGPGEFSLRGGRKILWVGVAAVAGLVELHTRTAEALGSIGFKPEKRAYLPHITLARLAARIPATVAAKFSAQPLPDPRIEFHCERFALYASETAPDGARYQVLESFPLAAGGI